MDLSLLSKAVLRAFENSGKRHLILTGSRGSGKTSMYSLLKNALQWDFCGYSTCAVPRSHVVFRDTLTEKETVIAAFDDALPGRDHKMRLNETAFFRCVEETLNNNKLFAVIDEIGYLEAELPDFQMLLRKTMSEKRLLMTLRKENLPLMRELLSRQDVFCVDLDDPFAGAGCVIMASGAGKRFGSNKLLHDFAGQPLFTRILAATKGLCRVSVTRHSEIAVHCKEQDIPCILHEDPERVATIRLGVEALPSCDTLTFCPSDQPLLTRETLIALLLLGKNLPGCICRVKHGNTPGAPVLFPKECFYELTNLLPGESGKTVMRRHADKVRYLAAGEEELYDIDTPEDPVKLLELLKNP